MDRHPQSKAKLGLLPSIVWGVYGSALCEALVNIIIVQAQSIRISTSAPICKNHHTDAAITGQLEGPLSLPHLVGSVASGQLHLFVQQSKHRIRGLLLVHQGFQDEGHSTSSFRLGNY